MWRRASRPSSPGGSCRKAILNHSSCTALFRSGRCLITMRLEPGGRATSATRDIVNQSGIEQKFGADVSLTGPTYHLGQRILRCARRYCTQQCRDGRNRACDFVAGAAIAAARCCGLVTLAVGTPGYVRRRILMVGALNPISLAFAVLFVGLGAILPFSTASAIAQNGMKNRPRPLAYRFGRLGGYSAHTSGGRRRGRLLVLYPHGLHWLGAAGHYRRLRHGGRLRDEPDLLPALIRAVIPA